MAKTITSTTKTVKEFNRPGGREKMMMRHHQEVADMSNTAVFHFDPETGEYLSASVAVESSLQPGIPILPANSTFDPPPACGKREVPVRVGNTWVCRPDWREVKLYSTEDGSDVVIDAIGQVPDDVSATELQKPDETFVWKNRKWVADVNRRAEVKKRRQALAWETIKAERDRRTEVGGFRVGDKWFHSDKISRCQQINLALTGDAIQSNLQWKTMDGSFVTMTASLAKQILSASAASDQAIFAAAEQHKAAMLEADDPATYDFSKGWPEKFE